VESIPSKPIIQLFSMYEKFFESSKEMLFPHENKDVQISKMLIGKQVWPSC